MDFLIILKDIIHTFIQEHLYISIALGASLVFLLLRKPRVFFAIVVLTVLLTGVLYIISLVSSIGVEQKQKLLQKDEQLYKEH